MYVPLWARASPGDALRADIAIQLKSGAPSSTAATSDSTGAGQCRAQAHAVRSATRADQKTILSTTIAKKARIWDYQRSGIFAASLICSELREATEARAETLGDQCWLDGLRFRIDAVKEVSVNSGSHQKGFSCAKKPDTHAIDFWRAQLGMECHLLLVVRVGRRVPFVLERRGGFSSKAFMASIGHSFVLFPTVFWRPRLRLACVAGVWAAKEETVDVPATIGWEWQWTTRNRSQRLLPSWHGWFSVVHQTSDVKNGCE